MRDANGAQGRDRTTDTAIFSRMLYQLSYLGTAGAGRERRFIVRRACPVHHASPAATRGAAGMDNDRPDPAPHLEKRAKWRSIGVFVIVLGGGNGVGIRQPAVQVDITAALGTERPRGLGGRLAADRARLGRAGAALL